MLLFISFTLLDLADILIVAFLMYQLFRQLKGTVAINIFIGLFSIYLLWLIVKALNMKLLSSILGQFIGVGVIALIIVFQQEIRRFLLFIGTRYLRKEKFSFNTFFSFKVQAIKKSEIDCISDACFNMSHTKTGALLVITQTDDMQQFSESGELIEAKISSDMIECLFFKNNPLHDGAVLIIGNKIHAARCILPVTNRTDLPSRLGTRHRAALGLTEMSSATVIIVSEETGQISYAQNGEIYKLSSKKELSEILNQPPK